MTASTPPSTDSGIDASALSRRELQYLARELELCRGNAKSDVIVEHLVALMTSSDGAARVATVVDAMPEEYKTRTPAAKTATPARRATRETPREGVTPQALSFEEDATPSKKSTRKMDFNDKGKQEEHPMVTPQSSQTPTKSKITHTKKETPKEEVKTVAKESTPAKESTTPVEKESTPAKKDKTTTKSATITSEGPNAELQVSTKTPPRRLTSMKTGRSPLANVSNIATKRSSTSAPATVEELLESVGDLVTVGSDRVKCTTTGHEMKADFDVISAYISGKRYQRAHKQMVSFAKFAPMFVGHPDEKQSHLVWCSVTQSAIARNVERIEAHMNGARYQKELPGWQAEQAAQKEQAAEKEARAKAQDTKKSPGAKRKASGAIPAEDRRVKVPRREAK